MFDFWVLTPCLFVCKYQRFGGKVFTFIPSCRNLNPEEIGSMYIQNVGPQDIKTRKTSIGTFQRRENLMS